MVGLETALAATGLKILGQELVDWLKQRGDDLTEDDWAEMGLLIRRKLAVDYENVKSSHLHRSRKPTIVSRIESAAEIYRELALVGEEEGFDEDVIEAYSELADICSNWSIQTEGLGVESYNERAREFFEREEEYRELVQ